MVGKQHINIRPQAVIAGLANAIDDQRPSYGGWKDVLFARLSFTQAENASHTEFLSCSTQARPEAVFLFALRDDPGRVVEAKRPLCCLDDTRECPSLIVSRRACIPTGGMYTCTPLKVGTRRPSVPPETDGAFGLSASSPLPS